MNLPRTRPYLDGEVFRDQETHPFRQATSPKVFQNLVRGFHTSPHVSDLGDGSFFSFLTAFLPLHPLRSRGSADARNGHPSRSLSNLETGATKISGFRPTS